MKLLSRSKSRRDNGPQPHLRHSRVVQDMGRRPSTSHKLFRHRSRLDDDQPRPQTADAVGTLCNPDRLSFFEAFEIQSGNDVFSFPRPQSARTVQTDLKPMASPSPSTQSPTAIGLACGSPLHPPPDWHDDEPISERTPVNKASRLDVVENAYQEEHGDGLAPPQQQHANKKSWRRIGSLFRRHTRSGRPQKLQQQFENGPPRLPRRSRTEPLNTSEKYFEAVRDEVHDPQRYAQGRTRSTAKMQSVLGVKSLTELDEEFMTPTLPASHNKAPTRPPPAIPVAPHSAPVTVLNLNKPLPPRLELALPSYKLDRYSIMFEDVLDPKRSLFERRKSRLVDRGLALKHDDLSESRPQALSPIAPSVADFASLDEPTTAKPSSSLPCSPLPPEVPSKDTPPTISPRLDRPDILPDLLPSPLQTHLPPVETNDGRQTSLTFFDSPSSDEDDEDLFSPQTPSTVSPEYSKIQVFGDTASQHAVPSNTIGENKEMSSTVWHAVLPPAPQSSTSSRFSLDVHASPESPTLPRRSKSFHGRGRGSSRSPPRSAQVAVARSISVSKMRKGSVKRTDSKRSIKPRVIEVGALAHSKGTAALAHEDERRHSTYYGLAM